MQHSLACGLAAAVLLLAGCASPPADPATPGTGTQTGSHSTHVAMGHIAATPAVLRNALAAPVHKTVWANGTVAFQDTCNTGACVVDDSRALHVTDITADLPAGAPVQVSLDLSYQPAPTQDTVGNGFDLWIQSDKATFYTYTFDWAPDRIAVRAVLLAAGTIEVVMGAIGPGGGMPETPYTLRIAIDADPAAVPPGVPVAVSLGPGATLSAAAQGRPVPFLLYGPTDALVGKPGGSHTLADAAPKGEYIVLLPPGSPPANLTTDSGDVRMAILDLRFETGPAGSLPPHGAYDGSWDVAGTPLVVGLMAHTVPTAAGPAPLASTGFTMRMTGPNGFVLETPEICQGCLNVGRSGFFWGSDIGDERLGPGSYAIHAETDATYDVQVTPVAVYAQR